MREIEYRAWLKGERKMVEVKTIHLGTRKIMYGYSAGVQNYGNASCGFDDCEIMQFTGLKDKSGVKIYEGDVVKVEFNTLDDNGYVLSTQTITGEVYFDINEYAYKVLQHLCIFNDDSFEDYDSFKLYDCVGCEVIGNIYDNPELIKESE